MFEYSLSAAYGHSKYGNYMKGLKAQGILERKIAVILGESAAMHQHNYFIGNAISLNYRVLA